MPVYGKIPAQALRPASNSSSGRAARRSLRARRAWKRYYHYWRLEKHGEPLPWHGRKAWLRVIETALLFAAVIAYGLSHAF